MSLTPGVAELTISNITRSFVIFVVFPYYYYFDAKDC